MKKRAITLAAIGIFGFAFFTLTLLRGSFDQLNQTVLSFLIQSENDFAVKFFKVFTFTGNWQFVTAICAVLVFVPKTRFSYGIPASAAAILSVEIHQILKIFIGWERPDEALRLINIGGFSFPSGHALSSYMFVGTLISLLWYYYKHNGQALPLYLSHRDDAPYIKSKTANILVTAALIIYIAAIAFSRIYLRLHWLTDVLGSWILGFAATPAVLYIFIEARPLKDKE